MRMRSGKRDRKVGKGRKSSVLITYCSVYITSVRPSGSESMRMRITQAPGALPTLRADGAAVIETEHEVLVRFYFDAPPYPDEEGESADDLRPGSGKSWQAPHIAIVRRRA